MDVTPLFKACVKTVKTRNKALGLSTIPDNDKNRILGKAKTEFATKAKEVVSYITKLRIYLLEHRKDYINSERLVCDNTRMTDTERDQIDTETQNFVRQCVQHIKEFRSQATKEGGSSQVLDHRQAVIELLESYLRTVCRIYSEQRAIRIKRIVDLQKLSRLEADKQPRKKPSLGEVDGRTTGPLNSPTGANSVESSGPVNNNQQSRHKLSLVSADDDDEELSPEEMQMFEQENRRLYEELSSFSSEIKQIEGRVVEISRLQEIFSEKVLEQEKDIEYIADTVVGTTENIKDANEELREAMKKNAGFRVWILFFLLVLSFSLLFLDWYNP